MHKNHAEHYPVAGRLPVATAIKVEDFVVEFLLQSIGVIGCELKRASDNLSKLPMRAEGADAFDEWCARERVEILRGAGLVTANMGA